MSGGKHTPGPWSVIKEDHDISVDGEGWFEDQHVTGWTVVGNVEDAGMAIAVIDTGQKNVWDDDTLDANTALVLAAPDLLAALQDAIGALEQDLDAGRDSCDTDWEGLSYQRLEAARAAIAKATEVQS